jgi:hypothetical protein
MIAIIDCKYKALLIMTAHKVQKIISFTSESEREWISSSIYVTIILLFYGFAYSFFDISIFVF